MEAVSKFYADIDYLAQWAEDLIASRVPDFVIGDNYLRRWWIIPRNHLQNIYLHEINKSDDDRALHDHPWENTSVLIKGSYTEVTPEGEFLREPGSVISRKAETLHRLVVPEGGRVLSLFFTGPIVREWGFACPQGWRHWKDYVQITPHSSSIGRGCGEL